MASDMQTTSGLRKKVILIVILLAAAAAVTILTQLRGHSTFPKRVVLKCKRCGYVGAFTVVEFKDKCKQQNKRWLDKMEQVDPQRARQMRDSLNAAAPTPGPDAPQWPVWGMEQSPMTCPNCQEDAFVFAFRCPATRSSSHGMNKAG